MAADYNNYEELRQLAATLANHPYLEFTFEVETLERPKIYIQFLRPVRTEMAAFLPIQVEKLPLEDAEKPTKAQLKQWLLQAESIVELIPVAPLPFRSFEMNFEIIPQDLDEQKVVELHIEFDGEINEFTYTNKDTFEVNQNFDMRTVVKHIDYKLITHQEKQ